MWQEFTHFVLYLCIRDQCVPGGLRCDASKIYVEEGNKQNKNPNKTPTFHKEN